MKQQYKTIDEYINKFPPEVQRILEKMRQTIHKAAPEAVEVISYQMPALRQEGILVWFAVHKNHIGFYPKASGMKPSRRSFRGLNYQKAQFNSRWTNLCRMNW